MIQLGPYYVKHTADLSPTLQTTQANKESMHHSGGAYLETQLIYGTMIEHCLQAGGKRFLIAGLGLGYIEWTLAAKALSLRLSFEDLEIISLENDPFLVNLQDQFIGRLQENPVLKEASSFFDQFEKVREFLHHLRRKNRWQIKSDWNSCSGGFHGICYDFYSSKQTPELWSENFLKEFLAHCADRKSCWFSTYACTGNLKRALKQQGFQLEKTKGFSKKRDSTFATRFC